MYNARRQIRYRQIKALSKEEKFERDQRLLWFKLHDIFMKKEYVLYDDLPEALKAHMSHFDEIIYPP